MTGAVAEMRVGVVGRVVSGDHEGFFIEVDDDSERPKGTGGFYVLRWNDKHGFDDWFETKADVVDAFSEGHYGLVEWMSEEQSVAIRGRHRHGET
ncbi:MAG: hypothetical protein JWL72_3160 [Ilumatobacteraceae bacterium]|nr:hypothetical protein [Ilumatobacteraceae bacterium]